MTLDPILKVAVNVPLARIFDYLPPAGCDVLARPGCRVQVPFGRQKQIAMIIDTATTSDLPRGELRRAITVIDEDPLYSLKTVG